MNIQVPSETTPISISDIFGPHSGKMRTWWLTGWALEVEKPGFYLLSSSSKILNANLFISLNLNLLMCQMLIRPTDHKVVVEITWAPGKAWHSVNVGLDHVVWLPFILFQWFSNFSVHHVVQSSVSDSSRPHGLQHARPLCPSLSPRVCPSSCPLSWWCYPIISSSVTPFTFCPQSFPASESFSVRWLLYQVAKVLELQLLH